MAAYILESLVSKIEHELFRLGASVPKEVTAPKGVDVELTKHQFIFNNTLVSFIYGTGYHAFAGACLDVFWGNPGCPLGEACYSIEELMGISAAQVAQELKDDIY